MDNVSLENVSFYEICSLFVCVCNFGLGPMLPKKLTVQQWLWYVDKMKVSIHLSLF